MRPESPSHETTAEAQTNPTFTAFTADDIYQAIAEGLVTYDLWSEPLSDLHRSRVYRDKATLEFTRRLEEPASTADVLHPVHCIASIRSGDRLVYRGRTYAVRLASKDCVLLEDDEGATELAVSTLQALHANGQINILARDAGQGESPHPSLSALSPGELARAVQRGRILDLPPQEAAAGTAGRTLRRWKALVRAAGSNSVSRNLALVDRIRDRGNRTRRLPEQLLALIERIAAEVYNQPTRVSVSCAYRSFLSACHTSGLSPCSYRAFNREIRARKCIRSREGRRSAYQAAPIVWYLSAKDPLHGVRPFEYVHIDHTPLDIVLISGETQELLGRPWLSLAIDAQSRAIVGFYLSFDPPSYRSCMMVLRDIVRRHGRMPGTLVTDNGAEFQSVAFQRVCELYRVSLRYRPSGQPRHGSVMERVFGTTHSQLIHNLAGNTKQLKNPRTVAKSVAPQRHAQWSLPALYGALEKYFRDIYGTERHPAHGEAPELHLQKRLTETGLRRHRLARLDRTLLIETCPPVDRCGERRVDGIRGVKIHHLWYWTEGFRGPRWDGASVPVRVDPWDVRHCYVLLGENWHQCVCKLTSSLRRLTRAELESYFEELTHRSGMQKRELTPQRIKEWMQILDKNAFDRRLHAEHNEARLIYDALKLTSVEPVSCALTQPPEHSPASSPAVSPGPGGAGQGNSAAPFGDTGDEEYGLY
jgi:putative transposase